VGVQQHNHDLDARLLEDCRTRTHRKFSRVVFADVSKRKEPGILDLVLYGKLPVLQLAFLVDAFDVHLVTFHAVDAIEKRNFNALHRQSRDVVSTCRVLVALL
jgi:hypothetical protein